MRCFSEERPPWHFFRLSSLWFPKRVLAPSTGGGAGSQALGALFSAAWPGDEQAKGALAAPPWPCSLLVLLLLWGGVRLVLGLARLTGLLTTGASPCTLHTGTHGCSPAVRLETRKGDSQVARPPEQLGLGPGPLNAHSGSRQHPQACLHACGKVLLVVLPGMRGSDES